MINLNRLCLRRDLRQRPPTTVTLESVVEGLIEFKYVHRVLKSVSETLGTVYRIKQKNLMFNLKDYDRIYLATHRGAIRQNICIATNNI